MTADEPALSETALKTAAAGAVDIGRLRAAHEDFLAVAEAGGFGPPPPGEWDAMTLLAHLVSSSASIASVALAIASGQRAVYDNRPSLDVWNLRRISTAAGSLSALTRLLREHGELLCAVAAQLSAADLAVQLPVLIISNDEVVTDRPMSLREFLDGVAEVHLPLHAVQLRGLRSAP